MRLTNDQMGGLFMLCFSIAYGVLIFDIPTIETNEGFNARSMPVFLSLLGILFSLILITRRSGTTPEFSALNLRLGLYFLVLMSVYGATIRPLGFILATSLFLISGFWLLGERKWVKTLGISISVVGIFWLIMTQLLGVFIEPWPVFLHA